MASMLVKTFILISLIFTSPNSGEARVHGLNLKESKPNQRSQRIIIVKEKVIMRKLLGMEEMLMDYHEPSANPSHEPRKGSPGGRA